MGRRWPAILVALSVAGLIHGQTGPDLTGQVQQAIDEASRFEKQISASTSLEQDVHLLADFQEQKANLAQVRDELSQILKSGNPAPEKLSGLRTRAEHIRSELELISKIVGVETPGTPEPAKAIEPPPESSSHVKELQGDVANLIRRAQREIDERPAAQTETLSALVQSADPRPDSESGLQTLRVDLASALGELPRATQSAWVPPKGLVEAAGAYFKGNYDDVSGILGGATPTDPREQFFSSFFRGAAQYATFLREGSADAELEQGARAELTACRRLDLNWTPGDEFSPRIREFYAGIAP
jgi:hypothetical protein